MRFVIFLKKSYSGRDDPTLIVLSYVPATGATWHSQSSFNGNSASNLVTFSVWLQEVATVKQNTSIKKKSNKKTQQPYSKRAHQNCKVNQTEPSHTCQKTPPNRWQLSPRCLYLSVVCRAAQVLRKPLKERQPRASIMSLSHFSSKQERKKKALEW